MPSMRLLIAVAVVWLGFAAVGCVSPDRRLEPPDQPPPREGPVDAGPTEPVDSPPTVDDYAQGETRTSVESPPQEDAHVVKPAIEPLRGRMSAADKQRIAQKALLNLQRVIISSDEAMAVDGGAEASEAARDVLATKLEELTYNIVASTRELPYQPSEAQLDRFRRETNANLAFLLDGEAELFDKFGNFYLYQAKLRGKAVNLSTHQEIASKTVRRKSQRALDPAEAAENALELAAVDLATYLTDEVSRKWEATSLIQMWVVITDIDHAQELDDVRIGLQRRPGVYYASVESWDKRSDRAVIEVLCRFDVREYLAGYIDELRIGRIQVGRVERDNVIKADQDLID